MDIQLKNLFQQAVESLVNGGFDVLKIVESSGYEMSIIVYLLSFLLLIYFSLFYFL